MAQHEFQTEVQQLLHLIIHSLYSNKEIFLRELVSNAQDALDKLKYLTVSDDAYKGIALDPRIDLSFKKGADGKGSTLTIADNGIGMNEADLIDNLGTIARSGTKAFLDRLSQDAKRDSNLIGQFGVGFYSAFMVADKIEVVSRKAGEDKAYKWVSDGKSGYTIEEDGRESQGTTVTLHLNEEGEEFANRWSIEDIVKRYSNHVAFPIYLTYDEKEWDDKGKEKGTVIKTDRINSGTALWRRNKSELKDEDYKEFYKGISTGGGHDSDEPLFYVHTRAEGTLEYNTLFFVPQKAPFDMYHADYKSGVKLYVKRVFITDDDKELLPTYLRFVRGVIDSEDLPLNVSREILQQNKILANIKSASVKKLLGEFKALADKAESGSDEDKKKWDTFITEFNRPLKEGLYQDWANKDALEELVRFKSTAVDGWTSFAAYTSRMKGGQKHIYYISGGTADTLKASPLLEAYKAKGIEVLIMDDEIDEIVMPSVREYAKKAGDLEQKWEIRSVNRAGADEDITGDDDKKDAKEKEKEARPVIEKIKNALGDRVKEVKLSKRLTDSPSCIVADENDPSFQMAAMMRAMGQTLPDVKPILEVNGGHPLVARLKDEEDAVKIADVSSVLLDQALLVEGQKLHDPADFVKRLNRLLG
ncbi:MAG: molecular chaperone HtpG [Spirochaetaceae bacterium]|jgi:molecular chaperone HtpG|nr:molecular chaperone HtpG [Spirochaetaceae bacterium]